jgi:hypothetical protein
VPADRLAPPFLHRDDPDLRSGPLRQPIPWDEIDRRAHPPTQPDEQAGDAPVSRSTLWSLAGGLMILAATILYFVDPFPQAYGSTRSGIFVVLAFTPVVLLMAGAARRRESAFDIGGMIVASWGLHLVAAYFRFGQAVDALEYNAEGKVLAQSFRHLDFLVDTGREVPGTGSVRYFTGLLHLLTGSTFYATFMLYVVMSFFAMYLFYRAFHIAFPSGDRRRYALLLFFWPTLVFWPSSMGKDACVITAVAVASYGVARLLQHRPLGLTLMVVGVVGAAMVRPHVAMIVVIALLAAVLFRKRSEDGRGRFTAKALALVVVLLGGAILSSATADFLDLENLGISEVNDALSTTVIRTTQGGSAFEPADATNPVQYPVAAVTILFRPFPGEAGADLDGLLASGTAFALLIVTLLSARRIIHAVGQLRSEPYVMYALSYTLVFIFVFSVIGNFGILDRQRTQLFPILFVIYAAQPGGPLHRSRRGRRPAREVEDSDAQDAELVGPLTGPRLPSRASP